MEDRYHNRDFERFVKENADQYRMFPSERVWKGIHSSLHTRKWWYGLGALLLLLTAGIVTWVMILSPSGKQEIAFENISDKENTASNSALNNEQKNVAEVVIFPAKTKTGTKNTSYSDPGYFPQNNIPYSLVTGTSHDNNIIDLKQPERVAQSFSNLPGNSKNINKPTYIVDKPIQNPFENLNINNRAPLHKQTILEEPAVESNNETAPENTSKTDGRSLLSNSEIYPLTIESVINSYRYTPRSKKTTWQFYLMPTVSYRRLKENMNFVRAARSNGTISPDILISYENVNSVVSHKPDLGFELGFNAGIPITNNFKFIAGLQFNVSKYDIRAFSYQNELATIALNSSGRAAVTAVTPYRSYGSDNRTSWLHNLYISASAPVGIEAKFNNKRKVYSGFAATLQPTYIIDNKAYLLSTDFKNYAEVPSLTRKWNLNTSFEIFAGIPSKKVDWRVGPQVRYQALSSFRDDYPLREHLFDFGLKLGVMLK